MLLSYNELILVVKMGVIDAPLENVNGTSIDITLDNWYSIETDSKLRNFVDLHEKQTTDFVPMVQVDKNKTFCIYPGQFFLAGSTEVFNLPNNLAAQYKLSESLSMSGLQCINPGWFEPGFKKGKLPLSLKNVTENQILVLTPGMKIGKVVFFLESGMVPNEELLGIYNE